MIINTIGGSPHDSKFRFEGGEAVIRAHPDYQVRATTTVESSGTREFIVGATAVELELLTTKFGGLEDANGLVNRLQDSSDSYGAKDGRTIVVTSALGASAATLSGITHRGSSYSIFGWPYGFTTVYDKKDPGVVTDRFSKGVMLPAPEEKLPSRRNLGFRTPNIPNGTQLINCMNDPLYFRDPHSGLLKEVPRSSTPLRLLTRRTPLGTNPDGVPITLGNVWGIEGTGTLPDDATLLVYLDVYRLAFRLGIPQEVLGRMVVALHDRDEHNNEAPGITKLMRIHPDTLLQAQRGGF